MKSMKKLSVLFLLACMITCFATGCTASFDASGYVKPVWIPTPTGNLTNMQR